MVGRIPHRPALPDGDGVVDALGWCQASFRSTAAVDGVQAAVGALSTQWVLLPEGCAVGGPAAVVAALLCGPTRDVLLLGVQWAAAFRDSGGTALLGTVAHI